MHPIRGVVQHYAWGSTTDIPEALGQEPDGRPWAEWWLGTHHGGPATMDDGSELIELSGPLPYLVKLLSAGQALSLQTHPSASQAAAGFAAEEHSGPALHSPTRLYRDPLAKPEIMIALTDFDALTGFRPPAATVDLLRRIGAERLAEAVERDGLPSTVEGLYRGRISIRRTVRACARAHGAEAELVTRLAAQYPDDPSVVVTLLLNRVALSPGEAVYLAPGNLHAYLRGFGVEVMGASDNVMRGGLTRKHVDVDELLKVLDFTPLEKPAVQAISERPGEFRYVTPGAPFRVRRVDVVATYTSAAQGPEIWLALRTGEPLGSWFVADGDTATVTGPATLFRVSAG